MTTTNRPARHAYAFAMVTFAVIQGCSTSDTGDGTQTPGVDGGTDATTSGGHAGDSGGGTGTTGGDGAVGASDSGTEPTPGVDSGTIGGDDSGPPGTDASTPQVDSGALNGKIRFVAFGDSRDNADLHKAVVDALASKNPQLVLDTGDLWAGYGSAQWATITKANANLASLLNSNLYLVSRGNHETVSELLAFKPTLVRENKETYGFVFGNAFFVSVGMDPSAATTFLDAQLKRPEAQSAKWRFVYSHYPIYDSGDTHGVNGNAAVEKICDQYHVTAFFSGHEHIYERSYQMSARAVVDKTDALKASKGTVYVVSGGGGAPFYDVASPLPSSRLTKTHVNHYVLVEATDTAVTADVLDPQGTKLDHFTIAQ